MYRCNRAMRMRDCPGVGVSDVNIGPFVFNYIANFVRLQRKGGPYTIESIEKALLSGGCFENIAKIDSRGLQDTLQALRDRNSAGPDFAPNLTVQQATEYDSAGVDVEILRQEEEKYKSALQRLFDLYLFDSSAMSQKDYMLKKEELESKLQEVQDAIEKSINESGCSMDAPDVSFIKKASAFVVNQRILSKKEIDFEDLATKCDAEVLKDLITSTIEKIGVKSGKVEFIKFQSGLVHRFEYKE